jgi:hypothetical protein
VLPPERVSQPPAGHYDATGGASRGQFFRATILVLLTLSAYLYLPLTSGGRVLVPSYPTVALIPLLFLLVRKSLSTADRLFLPKVAFVLLISVAFSPGYAYVMEKFFSIVQFCVALAVTVMTVRLMKQLSRETAERALLIIWCLLLVGSVLEVMGLTRSVSDAFRVWAFDGTYTLYSGDERDVGFVGWVRPKVFSTEPSAVSKMFLVSVNAWLLCRVTATKAAVVAAVTGAMLVIMGSPMFAVSAAITLAILVWDRRAGIRTKIAMIAAALIVSVLFIAFFGESVLSNLETRVARIGDTEASGQLDIGSENLRAVIPWLTLLDTWTRYPFFGVGFGGKEVVLEESAFSDTNYRVAMGSNSAAEVGTYLGLLGGAWLIWLLLRQVAHTGGRRVGLLLLLLFLFSLLMGALDSFRFWGHAALLWGALAVADSAGDESAKPVPSKKQRNEKPIEGLALVPSARAVNLQAAGGEERS